LRLGFDRCRLRLRRPDVARHFQAGVAQLGTLSATGIIKQMTRKLQKDYAQQSAHA
jgi:hypothetical protein